MNNEKTESGKTSLYVTRRNLLAVAGALIVEQSVAAEAAGERSIVAVDKSDLRPTTLRCEYRVNPLGIDVTRPRLSWTIDCSGYNQHQTAYQILVANSERALASGSGNLWNSGQVASGSTTAIVYGGKPLKSRTRGYWKVRVWDRNGKSSAWSEPAHWTVGIGNSDWSARWITDATLADPKNRPRTPIHCYMSATVRSPSEVKWLVIDLGTPTAIDGVRLSPARPEGESTDIRTVLYPVRFKIEAANTPKFTDAVVVVDKTQVDVTSPRTNLDQTEIYRFAKATLRYVRVTVTKLALWDANDYGVALGRFQVFSGSSDVSTGAKVTALDSVEDFGWSTSYLTDPDAKVVYRPESRLFDPSPNVTTRRSRVPELRREFDTSGKIARATMYCAGRGFYEMSINGKSVTDSVLAGGFTQYTKRIQYQVYDVTGSLTHGKNVAEARLGYGWYAGHMNVSNNEYIFGFFPQILAQLEIEYTDGRTQRICTDKEWSSTLDGAVIWSDILDGQGYDYRKHLDAGDITRSEKANWQPVAVIPRDYTSLIWQRAPEIKHMQSIAPVAVRKVADSTYVLDVGQEISGWCRLNTSGNDETKVTLRHAEQRLADGNIDARNLWGTAAEEDYRLEGAGNISLEPSFTWHGFRFVELDGVSNAPGPDTITAEHVRSDCRQTGFFHCSNPLFNKLMNASRWTQQNLMLDVPAGCAGRSERLAWTGDIRPCVQTALMHFDSVAFFEKYAADMRTDQKADGRFTDICPHAALEGTDICVGSPGWADAGVSLAWQVYLNTGDKGVLADNYAAANKWVDYIYAKNQDLIWENELGMSWGDWLSAGPATPLHIGSTAFFCNDADIVSRTAEILGNVEDAARYRVLAQNIRKAFVKNFVTPEGRIGLLKNGAFGTTLDGEAQGSYALALHFGLLDEPVRALSVQRLVEMVEANGYHPTTGFWSSVELLLALTDNGHHDVAAKMMNLTTVPSWGHMVQGDGTTCWESFDADTHNLSLNHWTHSAIGEWLWRNVAGIAPDPGAPGFENVIIRPRPTAEVNSATASMVTVKGKISVTWQKTMSGFELCARIPGNVTATVYLPANGSLTVAQPRDQTNENAVQLIQTTAENCILRTQSGDYTFKIA
jgi:alpha-L-rhamnosidase